MRPARVSACPLCTLVVLSLLASAAAGCERELSEQPPPLRPLIYTEAPPEPDDVVEIVEAAPQFIAPEDLGVAIYQALVEHDRELFEQVFVSGPELVALINARADKAERDAAGFVEGSQGVWQLFMPAEPSEEPVGGLASRLRLVEFKVGKGRDISGKLVRPGDEVVMHWSSDLRLELRGTDKIFNLRVPKIVKTSQGWKLMGDLDVDNTLRTYLESGMHLKPELLTSEHYPLPLEVGNFWKYRIKYGGPRPRRAPPPPAEDADADAGSDAVAEPLEPLADPTIRISVLEITRREGYLIAALEHELVDYEPNVSTERLLVTPRRVYPCTRDCYAHIDDISYLLGYIAHQTPLYVFPIAPDLGWGKAGRSTGANPYKVKPELERAQVPAGDFADALVISGSIEEGLEERFFVPGTGVVKRTVRSGLGPRTEELIEHRLML